MRNRNNVAIAALILVLLALALLSRPLANQSSTSDVRASTFRTSPHGAAAVWHLLEELDIPARRQLRSWVGDTTSGAIALLGPVQPATPAEAAALRAWIRGGNTLIYAPGGGFDGIGTTFGFARQSLRPDSLSSLEAVRWDGAAALAEEHALTRGIDSVSGFTAAFRETSSVRSDSVSVIMRAAGGEPTVLEFRFGSGRVYAISDVGVITNSRLRDNGAALLFARMAAAGAGDGVVRFAEYHHGYREGSATQAVLRYLTTSGPGRMLLQLAVAAAALLLLAGTRFGAPIVEQRERRRSPLEHAEALASAYRRGRAHTAARALLLRGLERRVGRRMIQGREALPPPSLETTEAGRVLKREWERGDDGELVSLANAVDEFVREVRRWK